MKTLRKIFALIALLAFGNLISLNAFPSEMATSGCFRTYSPLKEFYENGLTPQLASQKYCVDREFRKKVSKKYARILMQSLDTIIADKSRIERVRLHNGSKIASYDTSGIFPKELVFLDEDNNWGFINAIVTAITHPHTTIAKVYERLRKEELENAAFPVYMGEIVPLDFVNKIFPATMPTKDYGAFLDYDMGARIKIALSKEEREKIQQSEYEYNLNDFSVVEIGENNGAGGVVPWWDFGVISWADSNRMLFDYNECKSYYFRQMGDNVELITIHYQCV
ncbi:hypothetical protein [Helicobacter sp. T3_23-1059]